MKRVCAKREGVKKSISVGGKWFLLEITIVDEPQQHRTKMEDEAVRIQKWVSKPFPSWTSSNPWISLRVPRAVSVRLATRETVHHVIRPVAAHTCQHRRQQRPATTLWLAPAATRVTWQFQNSKRSRSKMNTTDKITYKRREREISPSDVVQLSLSNDSRKSLINPLAFGDSFSLQHTQNSRSQWTQVCLKVFPSTDFLCILQGIPLGF